MINHLGRNSSFRWTHYATMVCSRWVGLQPNRPLRFILALPATKPAGTSPPAGCPSIAGRHPRAPRSPADFGACRDQSQQKCIGGHRYKVPRRRTTRTAGNQAGAAHMADQVARNFLAEDRRHLSTRATSLGRFADPAALWLERVCGGDFVECEVPSIPRHAFRPYAVQRPAAREGRDDGSRPDLARIFQDCPPCSIFANGFSGHGLQQSPATGRGVSELIVHGAFQTLDLSPFSYERIERNEPFLEEAVI
jgi:hypothetical protein